MAYRYGRRGRGYAGGCALGYGYTVVVAEKPKAAEKIAHAIGNARKCRLRGVPYWIVYRDGERIVVAPSAGHLFGPYTEKHGFPVYEFEWRPLWEFEKGAGYLRKFYDLLSQILPKGRKYINACDYDIEGSLIGYMIIEAFGDPRRAYRMKFSSLSPTELRRAFQRLEPLDVEMVEAGRARHEMDWLWGINVSRALMHAVRTISGKRIILSAGRVQTPTLVEAVRRWRERNLTVPMPVFTLTLHLEYNGVEFTATPLEWRPETRVEALSKARRVKSHGYVRVLSVSRAESTLRPPPAFNLGDLQAEAARLYGYSPFRTQKLAEDLYLEGLISYPRTNSQKLPPTIDYASIIGSLARHSKLGPLARRLLAETRGQLRPVQGRKDDPAHPAIHPTGLLPQGLDSEHWRIYELIVRRFLAAFASNAGISRVTIILADLDGDKYVARGVRVTVEGWFHYYPYLRPREATVPLPPRGARVSVESVEWRTRWEAKRPPLSKTDLLEWMESQNIGTEATRARIIEILFKRGYLESKGRSTQVTDLGMIVAEIVEELFPDLATPELTRRFEKILEDIRMGRATREQAVNETIRVLDRLLEAYRERVRLVGTRLAQALGLVEPAEKCALCSREAVTRDPYPLCKYHREALERLEKSIPEIARRLGISEREALAKVASRKSEAGSWVVEVARLLSSNEKG